MFAHYQVVNAITTPITGRRTVGTTASSITDGVSRYPGPSGVLGRTAPLIPEKPTTGADQQVLVAVAVQVHECGLHHIAHVGYFDAAVCVGLELPFGQASVANVLKVGEGQVLVPHQQVQIAVVIQVVQGGHRVTVG